MCDACKAAKKKTPFGTENVSLKWARSGSRLVRVEETWKGGSYTCPLCGKPVFPRKGEVYAWCFGHGSGEKCDPDAGRVAAFVRELAAEVLEDHHRILLPPQTYRNPEGGRSVLVLERPEEVFFETEGKPFEAADGILRLDAKAGDRKLAFLLSTEKNPPVGAVAAAAEGGREVLVVDLFSCTFAPDIGEAAEEILLDSPEHKRWHSMPSSAAGAARIGKMLPKSALAGRDPGGCGEGGPCRSCANHWPGPGGGFCLRSYFGRRQRRLVRPSSVPERAARLEEYRKELARIKKADARLSKALGYADDVFGKLSRFAPLSGSGAGKLEKAGECARDADGRAVRTSVFWGSAAGGAKAVLLAPAEDVRNAGQVLVRVCSETDWSDMRAYREVAVFRAPAGAALPEKPFGPLSGMRKAPGAWSEVGEASQVNRILKALLDMLKGVCWKVPELYEALFADFRDIRDGGAAGGFRFMEDRESVLSPAAVFGFFIRAEEDLMKGKAAVFLDGECRGLEWDFRSAEDRPAAAWRLPAGGIPAFQEGEIPEGAKPAEESDFIEFFNRAYDVYTMREGWEPVSGNPACPGGLWKATLEQTAFGRGILAWGGGGLADFAEALGIASEKSLAALRAVLAGEPEKAGPGLRAVIGPLWGVVGEKAYYEMTEELWPS